MRAARARSAWKGKARVPSGHPPRPEQADDQEGNADRHEADGEVDRGRVAPAQISLQKGDLICIAPDEPPRAARPGVRDTEEDETLLRHTQHARAEDDD